MMKLDGMLFNKYEDMDVSVYATTETIDEFVDLFDIYFDDVTDEEYCEMLDEEEYLLLSRSFDGLGDFYWIVEPLFNRNGRQPINECEVALIERELVDIVDVDKIICDKIDVFEGVVTYAGEDEMTDWIDDVIEDLFYELNNLEDGECPHCKVRSYFEALISVTVDEVVEETVNEIFKMLGDEVN